MKIIERQENSKMKSDYLTFSDSINFTILQSFDSIKQYVIPEFIIIPKTTKTKFYQLNTDKQLRCFDKINQLSKLLTHQFNSKKVAVKVVTTKLNKIHIHIKEKGS